MQHAFPVAISDILAWKSHQASLRVHGSTPQKVGQGATKVSRRLPSVDVRSLTKSDTLGFVSPERSKGLKNAAFQSWAARKGPSV